MGSLVEMNGSGTLLITGGTGFVGEHLARTALTRGYEVSVISLHIPNPTKAVEGVKYYVADMCSFNELSSVMPSNKFDYVVNLSGYVDHSGYRDGGTKVIDAHFNGIVNLVDFVDWGTLKNFIQVGSSDEYGGCDAPQREDMREEPISPYSFSKVSASHFLQMLGRTEKFPSVILRLFLVYGPGQAINRFIPQIIRGCVNDETFDTSSGDQLRDFSHIDDIVNGFFCALEHTGLFGEVVNLASGQPVKIRYVIELIQSLVGGGRPNFGRVAYRPNENMALYADISKAQKLLSWCPSISLENGISKLINQ